MSAALVPAWMRLLELASRSVCSIWAACRPTVTPPEGDLGPSWISAAGGGLGSRGELGASAIVGESTRQRVDKELGIPRVGWRQGLEGAQGFDQFGCACWKLMPSRPPCGWITLSRLCHAVRSGSVSWWGMANFTVVLLAGCVSDSSLRDSSPSTLT